MAQCATTALAGAAPWSCVRGACGRFGGVGAVAGCCFFPVTPFPPRVSCAVCGGPSRLGVPHPRSLVRHYMRSVRSAGLVRLPFWFSPRFLCVCKRSRCRGVRPPPPLPGLLRRAHLARSRCRALVGPFHAVRAPPRVLPQSRAPFGLLWGGAARSRFPLNGLGLCAPRGVGAGVGTCHQRRRARSCDLALRAVGAARGCPGGASCLCEGCPGSGALPPPTTHPFRRGAGAHYPLAVGAGGAGVGTRHEPHRARSCELALRAVGAARGRPGGRLLPQCGASGVGRSPTPDHSSFRACGRGPLPTGCGCGGWCGDPSPTPPRALLRAGFARCGGGMRVPGGGRLLPGRTGLGALPPPTSRPFGRAAGAHYPLAVGAGGVGVGTRHQGHSVRSGMLAWRAVGAARGRPGGAPLAWAWGVRGRALSDPRPLVLSGVRPGPTTHWLWVRGVWAWGPVTKATACALACWLGALWGRHEGARGGHLLPGRGASGVGRSPTPDHSSFRVCGRGPLPTGCGCGECRRGDPSPTPQRTLLRAGFARCGGGMRVPGGGASCLGVGRPGWGALPTPTTDPFGRAAGVHYPLAVGAGDAGLGNHHQPHSARSCELALRAVGAAGARLGGAPLA